jgi:potassium-transporting ATPase KdpC subunit
MLAHLRAVLWLFVLTVVICCVIYPAVLWGIGQTIFRNQAQGSLIYLDGKPIGSALIAQNFSSPSYFHSRPSAVSYNASASGGSNLAASNPKLRQRVAQTIVEEQARRIDARLSLEPLPADMVTTSGSGLDPDITLRNAKYQADGVVAENVKNIVAAYEKGSANQKATPEQINAVTEELRKEIDGLLAQAASRPMFGLSGDVPLVNVLQVNLALKTKVGALRIK